MTTKPNTCVSNCGSFNRYTSPAKGYNDGWSFMAAEGAFGTSVAEGLGYR